MRKEKQIVFIVQTKEREGESEYKPKRCLSTLSSINVVLNDWFYLKMFVSHSCFSWQLGELEEERQLIIWNNGFPTQAKEIFTYLFLFISKEQKMGLLLALLFGIASGAMLSSYDGDKTPWSFIPAWSRFVWCLFDSCFVSLLCSLRSMSLRLFNSVVFCFFTIKHKRRLPSIFTGMTPLDLASGQRQPPNTPRVLPLYMLSL
jgi:hypothetical protein